MSCFIQLKIANCELSAVFGSPPAFVIVALDFVGLVNVLLVDVLLDGDGHGVRLGHPHLHGVGLGDVDGHVHGDLHRHLDVHWIRHPLLDVNRHGPVDVHVVGLGYGHLDGPVDGHVDGHLHLVGHAGLDRHRVRLRDGDGDVHPHLRQRLVA
ncbi:hypothetical protein FOCC_FOCC001009 [Frankliniella occidentalis]|nr:hypothetical protein FOCC_FOCC001009 [Frankliniella occidentalis]